jgi:hypothetical protein
MDVFTTAITFGVMGWDAEEQNVKGGIWQEMGESFANSASGADAAKKEQERQTGMLEVETARAEKERADELMKSYRADVMASRSAQAARSASATRSTSGKSLSYENPDDFMKLGGSEKDFLGL